MSFLSRLFGNDSGSDEPVRWSWPRIGILPLDVQTGNFSVDVVGVSQYQPEIKASQKLHQSRRMPVYLNRETRSSDDPNAVAVMSALQQRLGFLKTEDASSYAETLDRVAAAGLRVTCIGLIAYGERNEPLTLSIDISAADEISEKLRISKS